MLCLFGFFFSFFWYFLFFSLIVKLARREREYFYILNRILIASLGKLRMRTMARLPSTIYRKIQEEQRKQFMSGQSDGSISIGYAYEIFDECGYKRSTANKWMLNWAVCMQLKFELGHDGEYRIRTGHFDGTPRDMMLGGTLWLPVKEVKVRDSTAARL